MRQISECEISLVYRANPRAIQRNPVSEDKHRFEAQLCVVPYPQTGHNPPFSSSPSEFQPPGHLELTSLGIIFILFLFYIPTF